MRDGVKKRRRERYRVRDDVVPVVGLAAFAPLAQIIVATSF